MKSTRTPHVAVAYLEATTKLRFSPSGSSLTHEVEVPAGTRCVKLDGGSRPWVVDDLSWIPRSLGGQSLLRHDAEHYGIRVPEDLLLGEFKAGAPAPQYVVMEIGAVGEMIGCLAGWGPNAGTWDSGLTLDQAFQLVDEMRDAATQEESGRRFRVEHALHHEVNEEDIRDLVILKLDEVFEPSFGALPEEVVSSSADGPGM